MTEQMGLVSAPKGAKFRPAIKSRGEPELYDVTADPSEEHNVAQQNPNIVQLLSARLEAWKTTLPKSYSKPDPSDSGH
jgi:hypothetical protein